MTAITVISTFTTISPEGKVDLDDCSVKTRTVADVKNEIFHKTGIHQEKQSLWWHGYLLDKDDETLIDACVGVNKENECIEPNIESLVIFLTVPIEKRVKASASSSFSRLRSGSLDNFKKDMARRGKVVGDSCIVL